MGEPKRSEGAIFMVYFYDPGNRWTGTRDVEKELQVEL